MSEAKRSRKICGRISSVPPERHLKNAFLPNWPQYDRNLLMIAVSAAKMSHISLARLHTRTTLTSMKVATLLLTFTVVCGSQSSIEAQEKAHESSTPAVAPQVRPALPQQQLPAPEEQDAASRAKAEVDKARREVQAREEQRLAQETEARGYWADASAGLIWAATDNGKDITWGKGIKYCSNLRLAGYSDWRLPTIEELSSIYDGSGFTDPHPKDVMPVLAGRAKGGLLLTGNLEWSSSRVLDDRGHRTGYAWQFDFSHGRRWHEPLGYYGSKRALCVRRSSE